MKLDNFENNLICRFDLIIKYLYVKCYIKKYNTSYFLDLYKKHIIAFNGAKEDNKKNLNDFINSFNMLIDNLKTNGYNNNFPITIYNNLITNGAHRFSSCYYLNIQPNIIKSRCFNLNYNYKFFENRKLEKILIEDTILQGIKINKNLRCLLFFPKFYKDKKNFNTSIEIIKKNSVIFYEKYIQLTKLGLSNLVKELYRGEEWIGGLFPKGINPGGKYNYVVDNSTNLQEIYLIILNTNDILQIKKNIRSIYNNHHCVHTTDFLLDTFRTASSLLNLNSIYFLNNSKMDNISINGRKLLESYFKIIDNNLNSEEFCITSSIILELFGIRFAKDLDYLNVNNEKISDNINISCHDNNWIKYYTLSRDDIIFDPKYHFYFNGFKFATLNVIKEMKEKRFENKDEIDIDLIKKYLYYNK
jgi:hypothetical protein